VASNDVANITIVRYVTNNSHAFVLVGKIAISCNTDSCIKNVYIDRKYYVVVSVKISLPPRLNAE
jgi:hypothetical protein